MWGGVYLPYSPLFTTCNQNLQQYKNMSFFIIAYAILVLVELLQSSRVGHQ